MTTTFDTQAHEHRPPNKPFIGTARRARRLLRRSTQPVAVVVPMNPNGILFARALHWEGVPVVGLFDGWANCFYWSNSCANVVAPDMTGARLIRSLIALGREARTKPIIVPTTDEALALISEHRRALEPYCTLSLPSEEQVALLLDKTRFLAWGAARYDFPKSMPIGSAAELHSALEAMPLPVILKPTYRTPAWDDARLPKALVAETADAARAFYAAVEAVEPKLIVSEYIEGGDDQIESCHVYYRDGQVLETYTDRKLRQDPPYTGTGSYVVSCKNDEIRDITLSIFDAIGFNGIGSMEFKRCGRTGAYKIIEPTVGRPDSHYYTGLGEGINLPYRVYRDIIGRPLAPSRQSDRLVGMLDERADLRAAAQYIRKRELSLWRYLSSLRATRVCCRLSLRDPLPGLIFLLGLIPRSIGARLRKHNGDATVGFSPR